MPVLFAAYAVWLSQLIVLTMSGTSRAMRRGIYNSSNRHAKPHCISAARS